MDGVFTNNNIILSWNLILSTGNVKQFIIEYFKDGKQVQYCTVNNDMYQEIQLLSDTKFTEDFFPGNSDKSDRKPVLNAVNYDKEPFSMTENNSNIEYDTPSLTTDTTTSLMPPRNNNSYSSIDCDINLEPLTEYIITITPYDDNDKIIGSYASIRKSTDGGQYSLAFGHIYYKFSK